METKKYRFDEVTINFDKKRIPLSSAQREKRQGTFRYYGAQGVIDHVDDYIFDGTYLLIAEDGENLKSKKQNIAQVVDGQFWVNNHAHIVQGNEQCDTRFLCYLINSMDLSGYVTGSAQPKLSQANLNAVTLSLPTLAEQKRIVEYLYMLDQKIDVNRQINDNLEKTIKAVFKSWFLDFDAFDGVELVQSQYGLIPNGWHYELLGNLCDCVTKGTTPTTLGKDFTDTGINFIKGESINDDHSFNKTLFAHIDDKTDELLKRSRIYVNDIVFTIAGTLGKFALVDSSVVPANTNQAVAIIRTSKIMPAMLYSYFIGEWQVEFYKRNTQQAVQANLSLGTIKDLPILLPDSKGQDRYMQLVTPLIVGMQNNFSEIERLYELQNQLLARLSSSR